MFEEIVLNDNQYFKLDLVYKAILLTRLVALLFSPVPAVVMVTGAMLSQFLLFN